MRRGTAIAALVAAAAALAGCGSSSSGNSSTAAKAASAATSTGATGAGTSTGAGAATTTNATSTSTASSGGSSGNPGNSGTTGGSEGAAVEKTMKTYMSGVADGDGATACGALNQTATQQLVTAARRAGYKTCASAIQQISRKLPAATKKLLHNVQVVNVHVNGGSATAKFKGTPSTVHLTKSGGRWYIYGGFRA